MSKRTKARGYHGYYEGKIEDAKPSVALLKEFTGVMTLCNETDPNEFNVSVLSARLSERLGCRSPYEALEKWSATQKFLMKTLRCKTMLGLCHAIRKEHKITRVSCGQSHYWTKSHLNEFTKDWEDTVIQQELEPGKREYLPDMEDKIIHFPGA